MKLTKLNKKPLQHLVTSTATPFLALTFAIASGCGPQPLRQAQSVTDVTPVSQAESHAIQLRVRTGHAPLPDEIITSVNTSVDEECSNFVKGLPKNFQTGYLTVPEDWSRPFGRKIKVFYYARLNSRDTHAAPVIFYNGGPGGDSHSSYDILESDQVPSSQDHPFVYIDQRGTGCSEAYPNDPTPENLERLTHYGTRGIVRDSEALRKKLFGKSSQWNAFGQSYGGYIVHRYAEIAPKGLKGAYAHGSSIMSDSNAWLAARIKSQHRVAEDYFSVHPEDRDKIAQIRAQVAPDQCFDDGSIRVCGNGVIDAVTILLGFHDNWPTLHQTLAKLLPDGKTLSPEMLQNFVRNYVFGVYGENGFASSVISMMEMSPGIYDGCPEAQQLLESQGESPKDWSINECRLLTSSVMKSRWDKLVQGMKVTDPQTVAKTLASLEKYPKLKFFLYSGQKDTFVPVATFDEEVRQMGNRITYRDFPNSGHDGFYSERQVWEDLK